jgi:dsDNA-specific endonuclease/ATPase MutS2
VEEYLEQCSQARLKEVRIIHGRGIGVQRNIVRSILQKHPMVISFKDAAAEGGGWGATVVVLGEKS